MVSEKIDFLKKLLSKFDDYIARTIFFRGGAYNAAIARMLLAVSLFLSIETAGTVHLWDYYLVSVGQWTPKGLVKIVDYFGGGPPSQAFVATIHSIAQAAIVMMFVGAFSRISTVVAALAATLFCSLMSSFGPYWSHSFNVQLLAALAFMFGRSGDRLSVDALVRRLFHRPDPVLKYDGRYWWPVLFAELATHMFMFGAFFQKWTNGNGIWWAWSDNLRNSLAVSWGLYRFDPPAITLWVMENPWLYKTTGTLQLIAQASTVLCLFLVRYPVLRFIIGGSFFFFEILGLGHLFRFWHWFWIPLCLLSVDWEWLWSKLRGLGQKVAGPIQILFERNNVVRSYSPNQYYRMSVYSCSFLFFGYYFANIFFSLGEKHLNYPFSSMAFYSENRHIAPYSKPNYFPIYRGYLEVFTESRGGPVPFTAIPTDVGDRLALLAPGKANAEAAAKAIRSRLASIYWPIDGQLLGAEPIRAIRGYRQIAAVPPIPRPALPLVALQSGLVFVDDEKGLRGVTPTLVWNASLERYVIQLEPYGFKNPRMRVLTRRNVRERPAETEPTELAGDWDGNAFRVTSTKTTDASFLYTLIEVSDPDLGVERELYVGPENFQSYR